jgi:general secretion pathway protein F
MPEFKYTGYDSAGVKQTGQVEAETLEIAKAKLQADSLLISDIQPLKQNGLLSMTLGSQKVTLDDLEFLTSELSLLLTSGVKVDKALTILNRNRSSAAMGKLVNDILSQIKKGRPLSDAFAEAGDVFDPLYINLIKIGESTGQLAEVFSGLANDLKFRRDLRSKVIQAVTYPAVILCVCVLCILFVFNYIVPQMGSIFTDTDDIPVYTAFLLSASNWMIDYQWFLFFGLSGFGIFLYSGRNNPEVAQRFASAALSVPVWSNLTLQTERIRFSSAMALMLDAGVKLDNAIGFAANSIKNKIIGKSMQIANDKIKKGNPITTALSGTPIYSSFYLSLLEVGEESGRMQEVFGEIARRSKTEFEDWTTKVTSLLEPVLILVMGGIVGSVVVTMLLSVVSVNDVGI